MRATRTQSEELHHSFRHAFEAEAEVLSAHLWVTTDNASNWDRDEDEHDPATSDSSSCGSRGSFRPTSEGMCYTSGLSGGIHALALRAGDASRLSEEVCRPLDAAGDTNQFILHPVTALSRCAVGGRRSDDHCMEGAPDMRKERPGWQRPASPLKPKVGVVGLASPLEVGADHAPVAASACDHWLKSAGVDTVPWGAFSDVNEASIAGRRFAEEHVDAIVGIVASWYEDYLVLDMLEECPVPVLLWSTPGMETGALCGTQQLTCCLKQLGRPFACVFGDLGSAAHQLRALDYLRAAALHARLRRARIGLAGHRIGGMTHTSPNELMLKKAIGPRVVPLDLPGLLKRTSEIPEVTCRDLWQRTVAQAGKCHVNETEGMDSMAVYLTLRELVDAHQLDALTIGCYPDLMGRVCLAASLLAEEGIPMACEGDVNGAVGQLLLQLLTGQPTHNTDWLNPLQDGTVIFTHCGSGSFSLSQDPSQIALRDVRLMGQGVCALFPAKPGPVTLVSLIGVPDGYQCALLEGEALPTEMVFPGNPARVQFQHGTDDLIGWIHDAGIGHHWMIGYGHVGQALRYWSACAGSSLGLVEP